MVPTVELTPELLALLDVLPPANRRLAESIRSRGEATLARYLAGQREALAALEARRIAAESAERIPGLSAFQSAFVGALGPELRSALEAMAEADRAEVLDAVRFDLIPEIVAYLHARLRKARPAREFLEETGRVR